LRPRRRARLFARARTAILRLTAGVAGVALLALVAYIVFGGEARPTRLDDLCVVFDERSDWYDASRSTFENWGVPEAVQLSIIHQESSFHADAVPERVRLLGFIPGPRRSSAYGFGQILDATWNDYKVAVQAPGARRDRFSDVSDFIGWYAELIGRETGIRPDDAGALYLAYHEGPSGYRRGDHQRKGWLLATAERVDTRARHYQAQYDACRAELDSGSWFRFF
jgi:hypothetical protein